MNELPFSIFSYSSYLEYFQDAYEHLHKKDETFSYDYIASVTGLRSRTLARNLIKGIQKPSLTQVKQLAVVFNLKASEQDYLQCLVQFQAVQGTPAAYDLFQKLARIQKENLPETDPFKEVEIATSVLHMTLLALLDLAKPPQNAAEASAMLKGRYSATEIDLAINDLEKYGYIQMTAQGMTLVQKYTRKYDASFNFFLKNYHQQCLDLVRDSFENESMSERYLIGSSFSINQKVYPRLIQKINTFIENLMQLEGVAGESDLVVQVTTQVVKMTQASPPVVAELQPSKNSLEVIL